MKEIAISNGKIYIRETMSRKAQREYNDVMFQGVKSKASMDESGNMEIPDFPIVNMDHSADALVLNLVEKAEINGVEVTITKDFVDNMDARDFGLVAAACQEVQAEYQKKEETRKK